MTPGRPVPCASASHLEAVDWCDTERLNLAAVIRLADALGLTSEAWLLPADLLRYDNLGRRLSDRTEAYTIGLRNARRAAPPQGQVWMLGGLGTALRLAGDQEAALRHSREALPLARDSGDASARPRT